MRTQNVAPPHRRDGAPAPSHPSAGIMMVLDPASHTTERQQRIAQVQAWQRFYNMEPRSDSRLTQLFADNWLPGAAPDQIARELMATDFLYKHTLYGEVIEDFLRRVAARLRTRHRPLSWTATWTIVRYYGPIALKLLCLSYGQVRIPEALPSDPSLDPPPLHGPTTTHSWGDDDDATMPDALDSPSSPSVEGSSPRA